MVMLDCMLFSVVAKKVKNVSASSMGDKMGRIHMEKQDLDSMNMRRMDVLRKKKSKEVSAAGSATKSIV